MKTFEFDEKPEPADAPAETLIIESLTRLDKTALGAALGTLCGAAIFCATNFLILKDGASAGQNLILLGQYFEGFEISFTGSLVGLFYGFISGFILGWLIAFLRNSVIRLYLFFLKFKSSMSAVNDFIDNP
jgi:hypothetical protein